MPSFPYTAWRLTPGCKPVECTVTEHGKWWGNGAEYRVLSTGGYMNAADIYVSEESAIAAGRQKVAAQKVALAKKHVSLNKRIAALDKAESALK